MNRCPEPGTTAPVAVAAATVTIELSGAGRPAIRLTTTGLTGVPSAPVVAPRVRTPPVSSIVRWLGSAKAGAVTLYVRIRSARGSAGWRLWSDASNGPEAIARSEERRGGKEGRW